MNQGRPPIYETPEQFEEAVKDYFENGIKHRTVIIGKAPNQQAVSLPVPTITGLCLHLGFESRQSFYDYEEREGFSYTVKRARLLIEKEYEEMLQTSSSPTGAIFALKNLGWKDKSEVEQSGGLSINWHEEKTYHTK
jgi:hypothetical protein